MYDSHLILTAIISGQQPRVLVCN